MVGFLNFTAQFLSKSVALSCLFFLGLIWALMIFLSVHPMWGYGTLCPLSEVCLLMVGEHLVYEFLIKWIIWPTTKSAALHQTRLSHRRFFYFKTLVENQCWLRGLNNGHGTRSLIHPLSTTHRIRPSLMLKVLIIKPPLYFKDKCLIFLYDWWF